MQVGRNDVHHLNAGETGFFIITIVHDETCPWVSNGSRNGVKEEPVLTRPMMKIISMKLIINTQNHVFIFDVYLQYQSSSCTGNPAIQLQKYPMKKRNALNGAVAFPCIWSVKREFQLTSNEISSGSDVEGKG